MLMVVGEFEVAPHERDAYLSSRLDRIRESRVEEGCIAYYYGVDPIEPGRVMLLEQWESEDAFMAHVHAYRARPASPDESAVAVISSHVKLYDVGAERPFPA